MREKRESAMDVAPNNYDVSIVTVLTLRSESLDVEAARLLHSTREFVEELLEALVLGNIDAVEAKTRNITIL